MSSDKKIDLGLTGYDELFMDDQGRAEAKLPRIYDIPLSEIDEFPDHPFKVKMDEDMDQLVQSVKERGINEGNTFKGQGSCGVFMQPICSFVNGGQCLI